jgi:hypothetical protein
MVPSRWFWPATTFPLFDFVVDLFDLSCENVRSGEEALGGVAEWSCSGLQSRLRRFDSDPRLQFLRTPCLFGLEVPWRLLVSLATH